MVGLLLLIPTITLDASTSSAGELRARGELRKRHDKELTAPVLLERAREGAVVYERGARVLRVRVKKVSFLASDLTRGDDAGTSEILERQASTISKLGLLSVRVYSRQAPDEEAKLLLDLVSRHERILLLGRVSLDDRGHFTVFGLGLGVEPQVPAFALPEGRSARAVLTDARVYASLRNLEFLERGDWKRIASVRNVLVRRAILFRVMRASYRRGPSRRASKSSRSKFMEQVLTCMGAALTPRIWAQFLFRIRGPDGDASANAPLYRRRELWLAAASADNDTVVGIALAPLVDPALRKLHPGFAIKAISAHLSRHGGASATMLEVCKSLVARMERKQEAYAPSSVTALLKGLANSTAPARDAVVRNRSWALCAALCEHAPELGEAIRRSANPDAVALRERLTSHDDRNGPARAKVRRLVMEADRK